MKSMKDFTSPEQLYQELISSVHKYHPSADTTLIEKGYRVAYDAHKGQVRKSGEPYITILLWWALSWRIWSWIRDAALWEEVDDLYSTAGMTVMF